MCLTAFLLRCIKDLCTGCPGVQDKMASYLSHLQDLGVAGVRLDAAKHIQKEDLANIFAMLSSLLWEKDSWPINSMRAEKPRNFRVLKS